MILTHVALVSLALSCLPPETARIIAGIAEHENPQRDTMAVQVNSNGTVDYGLAQINSSNFPMLSRLFGREVNAHTIRADPCLNLKAAQAILFVRYNGNPPPEAGARYVRGAIASVTGVSADFPLAAPGTTTIAGARPNTSPAAPEPAPVFIGPARVGRTLTYHRKDTE